MLIAPTPTFGETHPEYGADIRSSVVGRYLVFYCATDDGIEVVRIIAGDRDMRSLWQAIHRFAAAACDSAWAR